MQSVLKHALCASALLLAACGEAGAPNEAAGGRDAWYAIIPFEVAPENRARVEQLSATTVAPAQAAIGREMFQFFPTGDGTQGFLILGRFDSVEDAAAHANPGQDAEFLAAYEAHMGEAGGEATRETMSMMTPATAIIGRRTVVTPPAVDGLQPDSPLAYYVARRLEVAEPGRLALDAVAFELSDSPPWDLLAFFGPFDSEAAASAASGQSAQLDGVGDNEEVGVVYHRPQPQ